MKDINDIKNKIDKVMFGVILAAIIIVMFIFINQKEGFHEDEVFSYGSSNYKYDNVYQQFGKADCINRFVNEKILDTNVIQIIKNIKYYYFDHIDEKNICIQEIQKDDHPIWRGSEEAKEYVTIGQEDIFNYAMVYYNQSRDIHPPLFYYLVHTVSIFFYGVFSKYIIFIINLGFLIASCFVLRKIMKQLNKEYLANIVVLLYGFSMGAISTVMFQRMYMCLTFFALLYMFINLKIIKNDFEIDKKMWLKLGFATILGFLTQYYFCIMAAIIAMIMFIGIARKRDTKRSIRFIVNYIKIALIGVILFPKSINDIFFSYRGVSAIDTQTSFLTKLFQNIQLVSYSFSIPLIVAIIFLAILIVATLYKMYKEKNKNIFEILILTVPAILYIFVVSKISPYMEYKYMIRYIMCAIPIIAIDIVLLIDFVIKNKKRSIIILTIFSIVISTYGFMTSEPKYLFKGYSKYLDIANEYKDDNFVYVGNAVFNQIQSIQEFMTYKESLILDQTQLDYLTNNEELKNKNEFILSVKKYLGYENILKEVLLKSGFTRYQVLLDDNGDVGCIIYKIVK